MTQTMPIQENDFAENMKQELTALWRFSLRLTANTDDASDLVQRTCVRALEQQESYLANEEFRSWIFRIQHRIWLNEMRSRKIRSHCVTDTLTANIEASDELLASWVCGCSGLVLEADYCLTQVSAAVEQLPEAQRLITLLVVVEGLSYAQAAKVLDVPVKTIMSRLARAKVTIGRKRIVKEPSDVAQ